MAAAKHYAPIKIGKNMGNFNSSMQKFLDSPKKFRELAELLAAVLPLQLEEVISLLKYKLYYGHLFIN
ncbi:MAG: hypothetical protein ACTSQI_19650 [Candidatus Helarchaeota archaeon]